MLGARNNSHTYMSKVGTNTKSNRFTSKQTAKCTVIKCYSTVNIYSERDEVKIQIILRIKYRSTLEEKRREI